MDKNSFSVMSSENTQRKTQQWAAQSKSGIQSGSNKVKDMASQGKEATEQAKGTTGGYLESAMDKMGEMKDRAMDSTQGAWNAAKEKTQNIENKGGEYMQSAQDRSGHVKDATMSRMGELGDSGKNKSQSMMGSAQQGMGEAWKGAKDTLSSSQGEQGSQQWTGHSQQTSQTNLPSMASQGAKSSQKELGQAQSKATGMQEQQTFTDRVKEAASQAKSTLFGSK
jgi:hypothetical protein